VYYEDDKYTVMEREIKLEKGALVFTDTLGAKGLLYRQTID